jgi:hypothetical protein
MDIPATMPKANQLNAPVTIAVDAPAIIPAINDTAILNP